MSPETVRGASAPRSRTDTCEKLFNPVHPVLSLWTGVFPSWIGRLMDLENRLHSAIKKLEELLAQNDEMYRRSDTERLRGKIDGIKLALSYLNEEKIQELSKIVDKHERMMEIAYEYSIDYKYSETAAKECGDYPAPCNCDDPRTHNGH